MTKDARTIAEEVYWKTVDCRNEKTSHAHCGELWEHIQQALESYGKEQYEKGVKEERLRAKPLVELARRALTCSRAASNKQELWDAWADNLEQEMKNAFAAWDEGQK
jgi:hypothetical protein